MRLQRRKTATEGEPIDIRTLEKSDVPELVDLLREEWYALHPELEDRLIDSFASP